MNLCINVQEAVVEIYEGISNVHILRDWDEENINEWLLIDTIDPGYHIISDDERVRSVFKDDTVMEEIETNDDLTVSEFGLSHFQAYVMWRLNGLRGNTNRTPFNCYN